MKMIIFKYINKLLFISVILIINNISKVIAQETFNVYKKNVDVSITNNNKTIEASFNSKDINIDILAKQLGFDEFNWVSYVINDPQGMKTREGTPLFTPYLDPPKGGYNYNQADTYPYYWDIETCEECNYNYNHKNIYNKTTTSINFQDTPSDSRLKEEGSIVFVTHLTGTNYKNNTLESTWTPLYTFSWELKGKYPNQQINIINLDISKEELSLVVQNKMMLDGVKYE